MWNVERHGAGPMLAGVLAEADIVRAICKRRLLALKAILTVVSSASGTFAFCYFECCY